MAQKVLTISIAAYNVANYIRETLDSLTAAKSIDQLEIFVVDDGGQDETLAIAKDYQKKYPNSIFPIHKENGGYGSTVNYSLEHATGKYFKLLDGDDWVQTHELDKLVAHLSQIDSDVIVTPFLRGSDMAQMETVDYSANFEKEKEFVIANQLPNCLIGMWALCFKTVILRQSELKLPENLFYTDQFFVTIPFIAAKTMHYIDAKVYCYRLGRDGQSIGRESRLKNIHMTLDIVKTLATFVEKHKHNDNYNYMLHRISAYYCWALRTILLQPISREVINQVKNFEREMQTISNDVFQYATSLGKTGKIVHFARCTNYIGLYSFKLLYPKGLPNWS